MREVSAAEQCQHQRQLWYHVALQAASDLLCCAVTCCAVLCVAGKRVSDVAPKLAACVEPFGVNLVEGVMSHIMKQVRGGGDTGTHTHRGGVSFLGGGRRCPGLHWKSLGDQIEGTLAVCCVLGDVSWEIDKACGRQAIM